MHWMSRVSDTGDAYLNSNMPALSSCIEHQQFSRADGDTWVLSVRPQCWGLQFWKPHLREESTPSHTWFEKELERRDGGGAVGRSGGLWASLWSGTVGAENSYIEQGDPLWGAHAESWGEGAKIPLLTWEGLSHPPGEGMEFACISNISVNPGKLRDGGRAVIRTQDVFKLVPSLIPRSSLSLWEGLASC